MESPGGQITYIYDTIKSKSTNERPALSYWMINQLMEVDKICWKLRGKWRQIKEIIIITTEEVKSSDKRDSWRKFLWYFQPNRNILKSLHATHTFPYSSVIFVGQWIFNVQCLGSQNEILLFNMVHPNVIWSFNIEGLWCLVICKKISLLLILVANQKWLPICIFLCILLKRIRQYHFKGQKVKRKVWWSFDKA